MSTRRIFLLGMVAAPVVATASPVANLVLAESPVADIGRGLIKPVYHFVHDMDIASMYWQTTPLLDIKEQK